MAKIERWVTTSTVWLHSFCCKSDEVFNFQLVFSSIFLSQFIPANFTFNKLCNILCSVPLVYRVELYFFWIRCVPILALILINGKGLLET